MNALAVVLIGVGALVGWAAIVDYEGSANAGGPIAIAQRALQGGKAKITESSLPTPTAATGGDPRVRVVDQ